MIEFVKGDMFESGCQALVNPVNLQGVMGAGLAKIFKQKFPTNFKLYKEACGGYAKPDIIFTANDLAWYQEKNHFGMGSLCCVRDTHKSGFFSVPVTIVNFPTKSAWRDSSQINYIRDGLLALRELLLKGNIKSIAIPPLGCGLGGLDWSLVKQLIVLMLQEVDDVIIKVYEPN